MTKYRIMRPRRNMNLVRDDLFNLWDDTIGAFGASMTDYSLDMYETDSEVVVTLEAPGFKADDVDITIEDHTLTISGVVENTEEENDKKYYHREISRESFSRAVTLPARVETDKAEASFDDGFITVTLPKAEEAKPKKINVKKV